MDRLSMVIANIAIVIAVLTPYVSNGKYNSYFYKSF